MRDTSLLSPAGMSLKSIGGLYPQFPLLKKELSREEILNMSKFFEDEPERFEDYARQDAKIVL